MQKTYTVDCFTHKTRINRGEKSKYLLKNGVPAIVSEEEWNLVQQLLSNPHNSRNNTITKDIERPKTFISTIKLGVFKGFIVIDVKWTKKEIADVLSKGENVY